jgi:uncharacterized membrane protein YfcA
MRNALSVLVIIAFCGSAAASSESPCTTDQQCAKDFNPKYYCEPSTKRCQHVPIYSNLDAYSIFGLVLNFLFNILANSIGVSSGGMVYCFLIFCMNLTTIDIIPILKVGNLFASVVNIIFVLMRRREDNQDELYVDWGLAAYCIPQVLAGCMVGMLVNLYFPSFWLCLLMMGTLIIFAYLTWRKSMILEKEESQVDQINELTGAKSWGRNTAISGNGADFLKTLTIVDRKTLFDILTENSFPIFIMVFATVLMAIGNLIKGSDNFESVLSLHNCSALAFVGFFLACLCTASLSYFVKKRIQIAYTPRKQLKIVIVSFAAGVLISVGITGSLAFSSLLIIIGIEPIVVSALSAFMLFFTSVGTIIQFQVVGYLDFDNAIFIGLFALFGAVIGNVIMHRSLKNGLGSQSLLPYILFGILALTIVIMPFSMFLESEINQKFFDFKTIC